MTCDDCGASFYATFDPTLPHRTTYRSPEYHMVARLLVTARVVKHYGRLVNTFVGDGSSVRSENWMLLCQRCQHDRVVLDCLL